MEVPMNDECCESQLVFGRRIAKSPGYQIRPALRGKPNPRPTAVVD
jgi:hypothetical protein